MAPRRWSSRSPKSAIDANAHIDNRGTPARGPFEYLGSATINNLFGQHEALTFTYAGVVPLNELNYAALDYKQVLTSEGLDVLRRRQRRLGNARNGAA